MLGIITKATFGWLYHLDDNKTKQHVFVVVILQAEVKKRRLF